MFVVCLVFFAAKLTTIHGRSETGETDFLFYVPAWVQVSWDWSIGGQFSPLIGPDDEQYNTDLACPGRVP